MPGSCTTLIRILLLASLIWLPPSTTASRTPSDTGRYIVVLRGDSSDIAVRALAATYGLTPRHTYTRAIDGFSADVPSERVAQLRSDPAVALVEPNTSGEFAGIPTIGSSTAQNKPIGQEIPSGIRRIGADRSPIARIDGVDEPLDVDVAVIDSGIQANHPDLNLQGSVVCADGTASDQPSQDLSGHGTAVAGVIAAKDNAVGVVGVAPGARLWSIRVGHRTPDNRVRYNTDDLICAVEWVASHAHLIEVANISLGAYNQLGFQHGPCGQAATTTEAALHHAICTAVAAGVTFVVASGEPRPNIPRADASLIMPAAFDEVITVSAMADFDGQDGGKAQQPTCLSNDEDDSFWNDSNYGTSVDFVAPGVCVATTSEALWSGTSFAAPYVAGAAALYKVLRPEAAPDEVKQALQAAAEQNWNITASATQPAGDDPDGQVEPLINVEKLAAMPQSKRSLYTSAITRPTPGVRHTPTQRHRHDWLW